VLDNAISAVQQAEHPELSISASCDEDQLVITFVDNGPGVIAPDLVFDPFYTTKAPGAGIGLGLSVAYGVIREHGGRIRCANTSQGGASFEISLPIAAPGVASIPVNT
jgi:two-component system C4-dicarboxylate transport sensor histidine kinase DctB